jgi:hypothetical protein
MADGALPAKIKTLMAMLCDALRDRHAWWLVTWGLRAGHLRDARVHAQDGL